MDDKLKQFMVGLDKLSRETGYIIGGCGCCESPWINKEDPENITSDAGYCAINANIANNDHFDTVSWTGPKSVMWDRDKEKMIKLDEDETATDKT